MKLSAIAICLVFLCIGSVKAVINIQQQCTEGEVLYEANLETGDDTVHLPIMNDAADDFKIEKRRGLSLPNGAPDGRCNWQGVLKLVY